jgi:Flp pilus assembly protein TadG
MKSQRLSLIRSLSASLRARFRAFAGAREGTSAIEFAIVAPVLIAVALATLQAASIFLAKAYFESGAEAAARIVLTNQTSTLTTAQFQTAVCNQLTILFNCSSVIVELEPLPVGTTNLTTLLPTFNAYGIIQGTPTVNVGATAASPGTDMLLVVMYPWPVFGGPLGLNFANLGSANMLMTSTQIFRIEPL